MNHIRRGLLAALICLSPTAALAQTDAAEPVDDAEVIAQPEEAQLDGAEPDEGAPPEEAPRELPREEPRPDFVPLPTPPAQAAPVESGPTCGARAHDVAAQAVVRVRSANEWAAGFAYHSPRHVVTAWSVISRGQGTTVYTQDGTRYETQLLARDEQLDLAVLELREPLEGVTPLAPAPETSAGLGRDVVAIGHPFANASRLLGERGEGLLRWSIAQGRVGAVNAQGIQADVALTADHTGGPLVDCEGRVLGMVTGAGLLSADLGLVARVSRVDTLIEEAGDAGEFLGNLRLTLGLGAGLVIDEEGRAAGGFYLTLGAVLFDRVSWMNRVGLYSGGIDDPVGDVLEHSRDMVRVESLLGYRFFVDLFGLTTMYIVPAGGLMVMHQRASARRVTVQPGCVPSATDSCVAIVEENDIGAVARGSASGSGDEWVVRPALGLTFLFGGNFEIGYTLEIGGLGDLEPGPTETYHALRIGFLM